MRNKTTKILSIILGILFMINNNNISFAQNNEKNYLKEKQFLKDNLKDKDNTDSRIIQITPPKPLRINGFKIYGIYHTLAKDPIPEPILFILLPDGSIYHTSEILDILKKSALFPKTEEEATEYSSLIIYCMNRDDHILKKGGLLFADYESPIQYLNKESVNKLSKRTLNMIKDPKSEKKDNYYIVTLYINNFKSYKNQNPKFSNFYKVTVETGKKHFIIKKRKRIKKISF